MAVAQVQTDDWIQRLEFVGGQRQSPFGPMDGVFYGTLAVLGDNTGGNVSMSGRLSAERKEDWIYVLGGTHTRVNNASTAGVAFEQVNTGPITPTAVAGVTNPTFEWGGTVIGIANNAVSFTPTTDLPKAHGMPIFGDKRIPGIFLMYAAGWSVNDDAVTYTAQIWGWIIRYASFFRGVSPAVG